MSAFEIKYQITSRLSNPEKTNKLYYWGDEAMFRLPDIRNDKPISIGGRLKKDLNIKIHSYNKDSSASLITNSIGLRNKLNFSTIKNKNKLRILNLGDSFSIGYAMDQNQFFGNILKKKLAEKVAFKDIEILNAETSDPAHCSYFIQHYIDFHNPNIVLYGLGINDIMQSDLFLNEEAIFFINDNDSILLNPNYDDNYSEKRFNDYETIKNPIEIRVNSKIKNNSNFIHQWNKRIDTFIILKYFKEVLVKKFEPKIKISQFSRMQEYEKNDNYKRLIDGNSYYGYFLKKTPKKVQNMYNKFFLLLKFMNKECSKRGIEFILLVYPHRYQIQTEYWQTVSDNFNFNTDDYDLSLMNKKIYKFCMENNIRLIDPKSSLNEIKSELFIDYDNHMNPEGYKIISDIVSEYIEEK